jgi:bla regulator protein BlaR1
VSAVVDHVWQSTWFALAAIVLAQFVRGEAARIRYAVWLVASLKFLVPFALLAALGSHITLEVERAGDLLPMVQQVAAPLTSMTVVIAQWGDASGRLPMALWVLGSALLSVRWLVNWVASRALVHASTACDASVVDIEASVPVRASDQLTSPGVVGIVQPVLLVPRSLLSVLTRAQLSAVIAHECWHVRRRDNLTAAMHGIVTIVFWFHPLVWWLGRKLEEEREHACDEGALEDGNEPMTYAGALLEVCKRSLHVPRACVASATGGKITARVRSILSWRPMRRRRLARRAVLPLLIASGIALPVASGMTVVATSSLNVAAGASSIRLSAVNAPSLIVVRDDYVYARNVSLRELISTAYGVPAYEVGGDEVALDRSRYDVTLRAPVGSVIEQRELVTSLLKEQFNLEVIARGWKP